MKRSYLSLENYLRKPRIAFKTTKDVIWMFFVNFIDFDCAYINSRKFKKFKLLMKNRGEKKWTIFKTILGNLPNKSNKRVFGTMKNNSHLIFHLFMKLREEEMRNFQNIERK
jgi:hypothetical protein